MLLAVPAQAIDLQARLFRGFADASRLAILEALRAKPLSVSDIVRATGLNQPNVSNHLACLRDCGLVASEQAGRCSPMWPGASTSAPTFTSRRNSPRADGRKPPAHGSPATPFGRPPPPVALAALARAWHHKEHPLPW
jgi:hypothetical protein